MLRTTIGAACISMLLLAASPAAAQDSMACGLNQEAATMLLTRFVGHGEEIKKLDFDLKQRERQWQADLDTFAQGGATDALLGNQLNRDWKQLTSVSGTLAAEVRYYKSTAGAYCAVLRERPDCPFAQREAANTAMFCSHEQVLQKGVDDAEAQFQKYSSPPGGDWRRNVSIPYVENWVGRVFIVRGVRTFAPNRDEILVPGDVIAVEEGSRATITLSGGRNLTLTGRTNFEVPTRPVPEVKNAISLFFEGFWTATRSLIEPESFEIEGPLDSGRRG